MMRRNYSHQHLYDNCVWKKAIKIYLDYVVAVMDNNARWEKLTRGEGEEE